VIAQTSATRSSDDAGFVMLAALWITILLSALGLNLGLAAQGAVGTTINRTELTRLRWVVQACTAIALAELDRTVADRRAGASEDEVWAYLDRSDLSDAVQPLGCDLTIEPVGSTLDVNRIDSLSLDRVLFSAGLRTISADSIVAAILDWRDADTVPRAAGAERPWYEAAERAGPSNRLFEDPEELSLVRGLEGRPEIRRLFGTTSEPIVLSHASAPVLASLSGLDRRVLRSLERLRSGGTAWEFTDLIGVLSEPEAETLQAALPKLLGQTVPRPEAWWLRVWARDPAHDLVQGVAVRITRSSGSLRVSEHRTLHR